MDVVVLLAGGSGTRWGNYLGRPKHLVDVPDLATGTWHKLLDYTITNIEARTDAEIVLVAPAVGDCVDKRYLYPARVHTVPTRFDGTNNGTKQWFDWTSEYADDGRTTILFADTWFTHDSFDTIFSADKPFAHFSRLDPSTVTGCAWGEDFGVTFTPETQGTFLDSMRLVEEARNSGLIPRAGSWECASYMSGVPLNQITVPPRFASNSVRIEIADDGTDDFDYPRDYVNMLKVWRDYFGITR